MCEEILLRLPEKSSSIGGRQSNKEGRMLDTDFVCFGEREECILLLSMNFHGGNFIHSKT